MLDTRNSHYIVCRHCSVRSFGVGHSPETGASAYGVNVTCLDDMDLDDLANSPISYVDGHRGTWHIARTAIRNLTKRTASRTNHHLEIYTCPSNSGSPSSRPPPSC